MQKSQPHALHADRDAAAATGRARGGRGPREAEVAGGQRPRAARRAGAERSVAATGIGDADWTSATCSSSLRDRAVLRMPGVSPKLEIALSDMQTSATVYHLKARFSVYGFELAGASPHHLPAMAEIARHLLIEKFRFAAAKATAIIADWEHEVASHLAPARGA